jgi:serine/threonine-protein kinase RsbW
MVVSETFADAIALHAHPNQVRLASDWLRRCCSEAEVPADQNDRLELCLNEVIANIIAHGGESALACAMELRLEVTQLDTGGEATLVVADSGIEFNPFAGDIKVGATSLAEVEPGGLGLLMLQRFSDARSYRRLNGRNVIALTVTWPPRRC